MYIFGIIEQKLVLFDLVWFSFMECFSLLKSEMGLLRYKWKINSIHHPIKTNNPELVTTFVKTGQWVFVYPCDIVLILNICPSKQSQKHQRS